MLVRGVLRLTTLVGPMIVILIVFLVFYDKVPLRIPSPRAKWTQSNGNPSWSEVETQVSQSHNEIFSISTRNGKYFPVEFGDEEAMNPSIIPHPTLADTWIIAAQHLRRSDQSSAWFTELVCDAQFRKGKLSCIKPPMILPIAASTGDNCAGDLAYFAFNIGPHDARVFYGPQHALAVYGSNSGYTCFGQWVQDFRMLVEWAVEPAIKTDFRLGTEIRRPSPFGAIEKNWFLFWDKDGDFYVHYDISPRRSFARLNIDGTVGPDLAPLAAAGDQNCMARLMPKVAGPLESVHQATNSLSLTLCNRSDIVCEPNDANTFIVTLFQHKSFYYYHSVYEPYVMLFKRTQPFEVHGISSKPIWIHGRIKAGEAKRPVGKEFEELDSWNQTEMLYVTSMSWKTHGQKYHGYLDDVLFIGFGIEDERTGGIDVLAADLVKNVELCSGF
ncbi:uncharacterized protein A1O9_02635 [Exophiala aquamarina CBS 119918]|uniref:EH domain-containing protein n=1 Tax=Exophiala aquamarina CBS 119918 TaxID=1182545 RepID=A0A072PZK0_9EURO|nr:uncharacterized protein A1O9_02635 [Exophiala aquamarina CBS 119918]KEF61070.1 hypothetical protein A1O9_02635 [Exophiala aquamarina CBS 119918]